MTKTSRECLQSCKKKTVCGRRQRRRKNTVCVVIMLVIITMTVLVLWLLLELMRMIWRSVGKFISSVLSIDRDEDAVAF